MDPYNAAIYFLISDPVVFDVQEPVEVIPDHWLLRPWPDILSRLKSGLQPYLDPITGFQAFEAVSVEQPKEAGKPRGWEYVRLPEGEWRYGALAATSDLSRIRLGNAMALLRKDLRLSVGLHRGGAMALMVQGDLRERLHDWVFDMSKGEPRLPAYAVIDWEVLEQIRWYHELVWPFCFSESPVSRALSILSDVESLPLRSRLRVVGYFSVLELLLVTDRAGRPEIQTIKHQIRTKMALLRRRFVRTLDYKEYFPKTDNEERAWNALYGYRNWVAHGDQEKKPQFEVLGHESAIHGFLAEAAKLTILAALTEPELVADLKRC